VAGRSISPAQKQDLQQIVDAVVKAGVQGFGETWTRFHRKFKMNSYHELSATRHLDARNYLIGKLPKGSAENVLDEEPETETVNVLVDRLVKQVDAPNGAPFIIFMPLVNAVLCKQGFLPQFFLLLPPTKKPRTLARRGCKGP